MNEYSFINMRETDLERLAKVKSETLKAVVKRGYHGATISYIAKNAGVSDGYLYRHYANKNELIIDLFEEYMSIFHTHIFELINNEEKIKTILNKSIRFLAETYSNTPEISTFIFIMDHDHNFAFPKSIKENFRKIGEKIIEKNKITKEIGDTNNIEDIITITFGIPIKLLEMRRKNIVSNKPLDKTDIDKMVNMCLNALK